MKLNFLHKIRLNTLLYNKKFTIALSVVLAFSLWLGISITENPTIVRTFNDISASVSLEGTAAETLGLKIISDVSSQKFSVTVNGPNYIVSSLKPEDFSVTASTVEVNTDGDYNLKLVAESVGNKSGFSISSISPSTINVTVDFMDSKDFTVEPKLIGVTASEGLIVDTPIISDLNQATIKIEGPRAKLNKIKSVAAVENVNAVLSSSQTYAADIVLYNDKKEVLYRFDNNGNVYDGKDNIVTNSYLIPSFKSVKVTQPIFKKKVVKCVPKFENLPDGMTENDISYTLSTNEITIVGVPESIDPVSEITLSPIDFKDVSTASSSFELSAVNMPTGARILENIDTFTIDINLKNYTERTFDISSKNFKYSGLANDLNAKTDKSSVKVKVCGPASVVRNIKAKDLFAVFNVSGKSTGDYTVPVTLKSDVHKNIWQVGAAEAIVTIY